MSTEETVVDGRVWRKSNSEGVPTWVSNDPPNFRSNTFHTPRQLPPLKFLTHAVRVTLYTYMR